MQITHEQARDAGVHSGAIPAPAVARSGRFGLAAWWHWGRHYIQMVMAMFAGMIVLGIATAVLGDLPGYDSLLEMYAYMAVAMCAPMVAWMRRMGHPWRDCWEMSAWMVVPMFALVAPVGLGFGRYVPGLTEDSLMLLSHVAMLGGMAVPMLYRWDTYALGAHCHGAAAAATPAAQATDPVCGMAVDLATAKHTAEYEGRTYAFCAPGCRKAFERTPDKFLAPGYVPTM